MAAAIILTWEAIVVAVTTVHAGGHARSVGSAVDAGHGFLRLPVIAVSASILVAVIATAEALVHLVGMKPTPTPPPITSAQPSESSPSDSQPTLRFHLHQSPDPVHRFHQLSGRHRLG